MSKIDYEFYYMSGLPIDLRSKGLGVLHQPKIIDFVNRGIDISVFSHPFIFDKDMVMNKQKAVDDLIKDKGKLEFLIIYDALTEMSGMMEEESALDLLIEALKMLYKTEDVILAKTILTIFVNGGEVIIRDKELQFISDLVVEMLRVNKAEMKKKIEEKNKQAQQDALMNEFDRRAKEYLEKTKKRENEMSFLDMVNVVVHSQGVIDYSRVFDMTVYQLRNSYETLIKKEMFNINLLHRISPNFKPSEDLKLWEEKVNIVKSNLN